MGTKILQYLVFIDVAGYTAALNVEPEKTRSILNSYDHIIKGEIEKIGGEILQTAGDGYFISVPATAGPIAVIETLANIIRSVYQFKDALAIRVGIHIAAVDLAERDIDKNLASRLESSARPFEINLSRQLYELAKADITYNASSDKVELKGFGLTEIVRVSILSETLTTQYTAPSVTASSSQDFIIRHEAYEAKVRSQDGKIMVETQVKGGPVTYLELGSLSSYVKLDPTIQYRLTLPPDSDLIKREERIENGQVILDLSYKWGASITLFRTPDNKIVNVQMKNFRLTIPKDSAELLLQFNFPDKPREFDFKPSVPP